MPPLAALPVRHPLEPLLVLLATPLVRPLPRLQRTLLSLPPHRLQPSFALPSRPSILLGVLPPRLRLHPLLPWLLLRLRLRLHGARLQCALRPASVRRVRGNLRQT